MGKLTALSVKSAPPGRHADGDGLYLLVKPTGSRSWLLRIQSDGRRRDLGLGSVDLSGRQVIGSERIDAAIPILHRRMLTLSEAREKAALLRNFARAGLDPMVERDRERRGVPTFREAAKAAHEALSPGWSEKGAKTFINSLANHAFQKIGNLRVDLITAADITEVLAPIWMTKPDMAKKVRQRIGTVLDFAHGKGWRSSEAPSKAVTVGLPRQPKAGNYSAMPYAELPGFVATLVTKLTSNGRRALLFQILTAARPGEVRRARWAQIDLETREWNRPADIMKGVDAEAHTVTLNEPAVRLLERLKIDREVSGEELIFSGQRGALMSDMTLNKVLRSEGIDHDAHGFRSSFRDWAAERMPEIPDAVAEAALAHIVPDKVVRAYKRTKFIEMRRTLLEAWGQFLMSEGLSRDLLN